MSALDQVPSEIQLLCAELGDYLGITIDYREHPRMVDGKHWLIPFTVRPLDYGFGSLASIAWVIREMPAITVRVKSTMNDDSGLLFALIGSGDADEIALSLREYREASELF